MDEEGAKMKRTAIPTNTPTVEVLTPSEADKLRDSQGMKLIDKLVQEKVAEVLAARDQFLFEPFFRSRQEAYEIRRLQTVPERKVWAVRFERRGCLLCKTKERPHGAIGFCAPCYAKVGQELKAIVSELMKAQAGAGK